jgi:hypothetical protein
MRSPRSSRTLSATLSGAVRGCCVARPRLSIPALRAEEQVRGLLVVLDLAPISVGHMHDLLASVLYGFLSYSTFTL